MPGRLPGTKQALAYVLRGARHVIAAGAYPAAEAERAAGAVAADHRRAARRRHRAVPPARPTPSAPRPGATFGLPVDAELVRRHQPAGAAQGLRHGDPRRGDARAAPVPTSCWRSPAADATSSACGGWPPTSARPCGSSAGSATTTCRALYGCADVFTMLCRNRWGGLEQEGFGIVFVEAAACGVPQVAGDSGGAADAVVDGDDRPRGAPARRPAARWPTAFEATARRPRRAARMGQAARARGRSPSSPTTCSPSGWAPRSACCMTIGVPTSHDAVTGRRTPASVDRPRRPGRHASLFGVDRCLSPRSFLHRRRQWVGAVTAMALFTDRRVRLPLVVLRSRSQRSRTDEIARRPALPPARAGDPEADPAHDAADAARCRWSIALGRRRSPACDGPDGQARLVARRSALLVPMFGFGLNGLWAAHVTATFAAPARRRSRCHRRASDEDRSRMHEPWLKRRPDHHDRGPARTRVGDRHRPRALPGVGDATSRMSSYAPATSRRSPDRGRVPRVGARPQHPLHAAATTTRRRRDVLAWKMVTRRHPALDRRRLPLLSRPPTAAPRCATTWRSSSSCRCPGFVKRRAEVRILNTVRELKVRRRSMTSTAGRRASASTSAAPSASVSCSTRRASRRRETPADTARHGQPARS